MTDEYDLIIECNFMLDVCQCCNKDIPKDDYGITRLILTYKGKFFCPNCYRMEMEYYEKNKLDITAD